MNIIFKINEYYDSTYFIQLRKVNNPNIDGEVISFCQLLAEEIVRLNINPYVYLREEFNSDGVFSNIWFNDLSDAERCIEFLEKIFTHVEVR